MKTITIRASQTANTIARELVAGCEVAIPGDLGDDCKDAASKAAALCGLRLEWDRAEGDADIYRAVSR